MEVEGLPREEATSQLVPQEREAFALRGVTISAVVTEKRCGRSKQARMSGIRRCAAAFLGRLHGKHFQQRQPLSYAKMSLEPARS